MHMTLNCSCRSCFLSFGVLLCLTLVRLDPINCMQKAVHDVQGSTTLPRLGQHGGLYYVNFSSCSRFNELWAAQGLPDQPAAQCGNGGLLNAPKHLQTRLSEKGAQTPHRGPGAYMRRPLKISIKPAEWQEPGQARDLWFAALWCTGLIRSLRRERNRW